MISNTFILAQGAGLQKVTAWPPLAKQQMLRRQIQWTVLIGKGIQAQGWECIAVHSRRGEQSRKEYSYATDAGHLHQELHSRLKIFIYDKEEMCMSSLHCSPAYVQSSCVAFLDSGMLRPLVWVHRVQIHDKKETHGSGDEREGDSLRAHTSQETDSGVGAITDCAPK